MKARESDIHNQQTCNLFHNYSQINIKIEKRFIYHQIYTNIHKYTQINIKIEKRFIYHQIYTLILID